MRCVADRRASSGMAPGKHQEHRTADASARRTGRLPVTISLMNFDLVDHHRLLQQTVREFAEQEIAPIAEELDRTKAFPYEIVRRLGELDLMGIPFPEEYGGGGGDSLAYALAVEELARVDSSVAITLCAHTSLGTQPLYVFGSEEQKREWLPKLCGGQLLGAFGLTEPEAGSDAGNTQTRATLEDGEWLINGSKQFITNAGTDISGLVVITAVTGTRDGEREISNVLVANGTPGYEQGEPYRKMGWNASDTRPLSFSDCRVPEQNLVGQRGAGLRQFFHILDIGRIGVAAMGVGLAQGALDQALAYAKQRRAFGKPISKFQAIQAKLANISTEIEATRLLVHKAALLKDAGRNFTLTAAQAKLKSGRLAVYAAAEAVQIHGGYGYIEEYPVCRFYRDAKILTIGEGTDEVQELVIARALGA
jgi:short-chain 2-methylacyl-CoA dehydrogenase